MYVEVTKREREAFISSHNAECLIPGYTGHCPSLKFRFGKSYGANTQAIMQELSDCGVLKQPYKAVQYRQEDPLKPILHNGDFSPIVRVHGQTRNRKFDSTNRCRHYILGYTGYIPGMLFCYGKSYRRVADDCVEEFDIRLAAEESRRALETSSRARSRHAPKLVPIRGRDHVKAALVHYRQHNKYKGQMMVDHRIDDGGKESPPTAVWITTMSLSQVALHTPPHMLKRGNDQTTIRDSKMRPVLASCDEHISAEFPPIAGYTGHIPRLKGTEASLSQRYDTAARRGLILLQQERDKQRGLSAAQNAVQAALSSVQLKYPTVA